MTTEPKVAVQSTGQPPSNPFTELLAEARYVVPDTLIMTWRNLLRYRRSPELLLFSTISPIMFLSLFNTSSEVRYRRVTWRISTT